MLPIEKIKMPTQKAQDVCNICKEITDAKESLEVTWIACEVCGQWYHSSCLQLPRSNINNISQFHCANCTLTHGPSILKRKSGRSRKKIDYVALNDGGELREVDKHQHIKRFQGFENDRDLNELIYLVDPAKDANSNGIINDDTITDIIFKSQLKKPILIPSCNPSISNVRPYYDLNFKFPKLTVNEITNYIGEDKPIPVMDVLTQNNAPGWTIGKWRDYFNLQSEDRDRIRNVISLEVSQTPLNDIIELPESVLKLDIVNKLFNSEKNCYDFDNQGIERPKVSKYILMSVENSFTDFHIDFGGTSVYYTILKGSKEFLMFPPTKRNLSIYEKWCKSEDQNQTWFADLIPALPKSSKESTTSDDYTDGNDKDDGFDPAYFNNGLKININAGDLLLLPSGWIHAVYTPCDSIIVGGNFLNLLSLENHLKVYDIEINTKVPDRFKFPGFVKVIWLIGWYLMTSTNTAINGYTRTNDKNKYNYNDNDNDNNKSGILSKVELQCIKQLLPFYKSQLALINGNKSDLSKKGLKTIINKIKGSLPTGIIGKPETFVDCFESWYTDQLERTNNISNGNGSVKRERGSDGFGDELTTSKRQKNV